MAIAKVQVNYASPGGGSPFTNPTSVTISASGAGNLLVAGILAEGNYFTISSITDNVGNTYIPVPNVQSVSTHIIGAVWTDIWYCAGAKAGATTVTFTFSETTTGGFVYVIEYSGVAHTNAIDASGHLPFNTFGAWNGQPITISNAGSVILTSITGIQFATPNVNAPFVDDATLLGYVPDYLPGATGTYQPTWTQSSDYIASSIVAFLPIPQGGNPNLTAFGVGALATVI